MKLTRKGFFAALVGGPVALNAALKAESVDARIDASLARIGRMEAMQAAKGDGIVRIAPVEVEDETIIGGSVTFSFLYDHEVCRDFAKGERRVFQLVNPDESDPRYRAIQFRAEWNSLYVDWPVCTAEVRAVSERCWVDEHGKVRRQRPGNYLCS